MLLAPFLWIWLKSPWQFVSGFEKISILQPGDKYGFLLINSSELSQYPEVVSFNVKYHDYYSKKHFIIKNFDFNLSDYVKYNIQYNDEFHYYDIKKNFWDRFKFCVNVKNWYKICE